MNTNPLFGTKRRLPDPNSPPPTKKTPPPTGLPGSTELPRPVEIVALRNVNVANHNHTPPGTTPPTPQLQLVTPKTQSSPSSLSTPSTEPAPTIESPTSRAIPIAFGTEELLAAPEDIIELSNVPIEVQERLAGGAFATVSIGRYANLQACALKIQLLNQPHVESCIAAEEAVYQAFDNSTENLPYLVKPHQYGRTTRVINGDTTTVWACAMPLFRKGTLEDYLKGKGRKLDEAEATAWLAKLAQTLCSMHKVGIHRDIKPENLLIDDDDNLHLADFGTAVTYDPATGQLREPHEEYAGTPAFSPRREALSPKGDIYSLGAIYHYMLTGRPIPHDRFSLYRAAEPVRMPEGLSEKATKLLGELLNQDPTKRPTAEEVVARCQTTGA